MWVMVDAEKPLLSFNTVNTAALFLKLKEDVIAPWHAALPTHRGLHINLFVGFVKAQVALHLTSAIPCITSPLHTLAHSTCKYCHTHTLHATPMAGLTISMGCTLKCWVQALACFSTGRGPCGGEVGGGLEVCV